MKSNLFHAVLTRGHKVVYAYFAWMRKYAKHKKEVPIEIRYQKLHKLCTKIIPGLKVDITVKGLDNLPKEHAYYICNHLNETDPLAILAILDKPTAFVCKKEIETYPFVAKCVNSIDGVFIDKDDIKGTLKTMLNIEADLKKGTKNWLIFPEGMRNKDEKAHLIDFHHGTFRPAMKAGVPIVPIALYGTQRILSKRFKFKRYPVYIEFGKPIYKEEYSGMTSQDMAKLMQQRVQTMISYHARQDDKEALVNILGDKYKEIY